MRSHIVDRNRIVDIRNNNDFFNIEKSLDGQDWDEIATIQGNGNSNELIKYSYTDFNPINGIIYYRLKQTDFDGTFEYFETVSVFVSIDQNISFYPNPVDDELRVTSNGINTSIITIYDVSASWVDLRQFQMNNEVLIDTSVLKSGIYLLKISNPGQVITRRFVKN